MTTQSVRYSVQSDSLLRWTLRANGIFSGLSGVVCLIDAEPLTALIGLPSPLILGAMGVGLLVYATRLFWVTTRSSIPPRQALVFVLGDIAWVIGSIILLLTNVVPLTLAGRWAIAIVADVVGLFAVLQFLGVRRLLRKLSGA